MKDESFVSEKRLVDRLVQYWNRVRKELPLPAIEKFNETAIPDVWQYCIRLSVIHMQNDWSYRYEYAGERIKDALGSNPHGKIISSHSANSFEKRISNDLDACVKQRIPLQDQGQFVNEKSKVVKYRCCFLPFAHHEAEVSHIVVGFSYKTF